MIRPPFVARVAAGLAVTAMEEAKKLPTTAVALPMTAVSQMLQTSMRVQQSITSLAIKGDQAFALINWSSEDEQPEWAVFDEDVDAPADPTSSTGSTTADTPTNAGRFALYSLEPTAPIEEPAPVAESESMAATTDGPAEEPEIVTELDYPNLTLAQLRARIRTLSIDELTAVLDYENATLARAPFQTMLTNRITTAKAK
ncbi:MAG: lipid droplet-associated protein [Rhodococcus qingshengii]|uniref:lipid droplet-associated protein n=1 Tax=Rhodococcus TaxID=1827 RepID=UPI00114C9647|nr:MULTISPECIES: lipid droplet-associated protein [Rhodococcus]MBQ9051168.1 lipid droplet-associated protein [Rhodococcus sp. (in: high G+C Gram-positive bacteria)]MCE4160580.1 lipid droplet-associated protein [Rhodococcus sp. Ni2]